jgi:hypothetical protein
LIGQGLPQRTLKVKHRRASRERRARNGEDWTARCYQRAGALRLPIDDISDNGIAAEPLIANATESVPVLPWNRWFPGLARAAIAASMI